MNAIWRPPEVDARYRELLRRVSRIDLPGDALFTSHWPLIGTAPRRMLIVGQAVFGWIPSWGIEDIAGDAGIASVLDETQRACYDLDDPMDWIAGNRARSSPFWRTVRALVDLQFGETEQPWYSHVAWANVYPVARNDVRGNPEGDLRFAQTDAAASVLDAVARHADVEAVVVFAGPMWWDVAPLLPLEQSRVVDRPLLAAGIRNSTPWVAGMHPGGAQRRGWGAATYARIVADALDHMDRP